MKNLGAATVSQSYFHSLGLVYDFNFPETVPVRIALK
jgi:hypothetical protein